MKDCFIKTLIFSTIYISQSTKKLKCSNNFVKIIRKDACFYLKSFPTWSHTQLSVWIPWKMRITKAIGNVFEEKKNCVLIFLNTAQRSATDSNIRLKNSSQLISIKYSYHIFLVVNSESSAEPPQESVLRSILYLPYKSNSAMRSSKGIWQSTMWIAN